MLLYGMIEQFDGLLLIETFFSLSEFDFLKLFSNFYSLKLI